MPIKVTEIELSAGIRSIRIEDEYDELYALIRYYGRPLGWLDIGVQPPVITALQLREAIGARLGKELVSLTLGAEFGTDEDLGPDLPVSVIVCTRNRSDQLTQCLQAITALDYRNYEVIVVDNSPSDDETQKVVANFPARYIREDCPGLDWARNRGIAAASHNIVVFTDDDAQPDRGWLKAIARCFVAAEVMAVTGFVAPAELETDAQMEFELNYGGMSHGFRRRRIHRNSLSDGQLLWASSFGVGANMAFRKEVFERVGTFDVALDVGTPSGGGGDIEMLHRIVAAGFTLIYEPAALVWHTHRRDRASLRRLLYQNGTGFGSYLLSCARNQRLPLRSIFKFSAHDWFGNWIVRRLLRRGTLPRRYVVFEALGALKSIFAYRASRRQAAHVSKTFGRVQSI